MRGFDRVDRFFQYKKSETDGFEMDCAVLCRFSYNWYYCEDCLYDSVVFYGAVKY